MVLSTGKKRNLSSVTVMFRVALTGGPPGTYCVLNFPTRKKTGPD